MGNARSSFNYKCTSSFIKKCINSSQRNNRELYIVKKKLVKLGYQFNSETDSEVIAHLLDYELKKEEPDIAIKKMLRQLEGAFAIAIIFKNLNLLAGSRKGSPLALGISDNSTFIGSDSVALAPFTKKIIFLEEGDSVFIKANSYQIFNENFKKVKKEKLHFQPIQVKI